MCNFSCQSFSTLCNLFLFSEVCYYISAGINPFLYGLRSTQFRQGFWDLISQISLQRRTVDSLDNSDNIPITRTMAVTNSVVHVSTQMRIRERSRQRSAVLKEWIGAPGQTDKDRHGPTQAGIIMADQQISAALRRRVATLASEETINRQIFPQSLISRHQPSRRRKSVPFSASDSRIHALNMLNLKMKAGEQVQETTKSTGCSCIAKDSSDQLGACGIEESCGSQSISPTCYDQILTSSIKCCCSAKSNPVIQGSNESLLKLPACRTFESKINLDEKEYDLVRFNAVASIVVVEKSDTSLPGGSRTTKTKTKSWNFVDRN